MGPVVLGAVPGRTVRRHLVAAAEDQRRRLRPPGGVPLPPALAVGPGGKDRRPSVGRARSTRLPDRTHPGPESARPIGAHRAPPLVRGRPAWPQGLRSARPPVRLCRSEHARPRRTRAGRRADECEARGRLDPPRGHARAATASDAAHGADEPVGESGATGHPRSWSPSTWTAGSRTKSSTWGRWRNAGG